MLKGISNRQRRIDPLAIGRKKNAKQSNPIKPRQSEIFEKKLSHYQTELINRLYLQWNIKINRESMTNSSMMQTSTIIICP